MDLRAWQAPWSLNKNVLCIDMYPFDVHHTPLSAAIELTISRDPLRLE